MEIDEQVVSFRSEVKIVLPGRVSGRFKVAMPRFRWSTAALVVVALLVSGIAGVQLLVTALSPAAWVGSVWQGNAFADA